LAHADFGGEVDHGVGAVQGVAHQPAVFHIAFEQLDLG
jgi:hypothetical protein